MTLQIWIGLPLGDDPFEVVLARQLKQLSAVVVNVITVQQSITRARNYGTQPMLAVDQWVRRRGTALLTMARSFAWMAAGRSFGTCFSDAEQVEGNKARLSGEDDYVLHFQ